ncbi:hypothetical protein A3F00_00295 [Candidatus Daviesbacteria bacterium RIFCSPHIGHO2_12_FULL_37_11]|uniref:Uncharacterized protein n=1 Tax=Candidatus Daviesbacteria bacterium RIFCSPHIGHO2_12_FULL_37_11 TaxID=1797777 RepID=A0A1F5KAF2_9BACT|nr:MAG: hypothetical protein A2111_01390 [Candidatus Daviesbacteria bacterium GWA1_38_6]OGE16276.1 MAG: hypothetical protein A2769_03310 [Candidatus Daviesbacteria bacterium RIFCSPHIGHO2_01_FULL_37_27]OGE37933.1 MAG: hypothetical protein A3F00_00295 [Candidatus Daviesbacteria bacterium RIFCSPHIGHO2_12_FULL_37_11]OGE45273.1 MAG: hypothetical protein A3B39_04070 [Candidatus Daviesbacteria bacterium RIFCSPLOWO2_01_FULL_37_10]
MIREREFDYLGEFFRQPTETLEELERRRDKTGGSLQALEAKITTMEGFTFETATGIAINHMILDGQFSEVSVRMAILEGDFSKAESSLKHVMLMDFNIRLTSEGIFDPIKIYLEHTASQQFTLAQQLDHKKASQELMHLGLKYREMATVIPSRGEPLDINKLSGK